MKNAWNTVIILAVLIFYLSIIYEVFTRVTLPDSITLSIIYIGIMLMLLAMMGIAILGMLQIITFNTLEDK